MNFSFKDKILIIAAHPDDETLGCGGTIVKAVNNNARVKVIFIGEGVSARFPIGKELSDISIKNNKIRENEAKKALKILKINDFCFGKKFCTKFDKYLLTEIIQDIEIHIKNFSPNIIFTHSDKDLNIDHGVVHRAVMTACRPRDKNYVRQIYSFEVPCSSNWTYNSNFNPNIFVDISKSINIKQKAFKAYKNENRPFPFPRSEIGIDTLAKFRGLGSGLKYAEAFRLERGIFS